MNLNDIKAYAASAPIGYEELVIDLIQYVQISPKYREYKICQIEWNINEFHNTTLVIRLKAPKGSMKLMQTVEFVLKDELKWK